jgi:hypothetical protein
VIQWIPEVIRRAQNITRQIQFSSIGPTPQRDKTHGQNRGFAEDRMSVLACDSRRKHEAWGPSPRISKRKCIGARETGDSVKLSSFARCRGLYPFYRHVNLGLAPQALCLHLLSRVKKHHSISTVCENHFAAPIVAQYRSILS